MDFRQIKNATTPFHCNVSQAETLNQSCDWSMCRLPSVSLPQAPVKESVQKIFLNNAISLSPTILSHNFFANIGFCFNHATATIATGARTANVFDTEMNVCKEICLLY